MESGRYGRPLPAWRKERPIPSAPDVRVGRWPRSRGSALNWHDGWGTSALEIPLNLRIDKKLEAQLKQRAAAAQIPTSALVRRLLRQAMREPDAPVLTEERVEAIARRVLAEAKDERRPRPGDTRLV